MKSFFLCAVMILCVLNVFAQTGWLTTGNSNVTTSNFLGTTNSQPVIIRTNNTERMRFMTNGNIGIGTKSPESRLHIFKGSAGTVTGYPDAAFIVENSNHSYINILAPDANETGILFGKPESNISGGIIYNNFLTPKGLQFRTNGNITNMVLTAEGQLGVGTTTLNGYAMRITHGAHGFNIQNRYDGAHWELAAFGDLGLWSNGIAKGNFSSIDGSYSTVSDERLKINIQGMPDVLDKINELYPVMYQFKNDKNQTTYHGFIAQQVQKVLPDLVTHTIIKERDLDVYTLNYSGFGVIAIKGLQELKKIIEEQQKEMNKLITENELLKSRLDKIEKSFQQSITFKGDITNNEYTALSNDSSAN